MPILGSPGYTAPDGHAVIFDLLAWPTNSSGGDDGHIVIDVSPAQYRWFLMT